MTTSPGALDERLDHQGRTIARSRLASRVASALDSGSVVITAGAGSGKTTILEQALDGRTAAWLSCTDGERAPGTLLMRIVQVLARAAPGTTDAMAERLAAGVERVEIRAATRELTAELSRLLVEPLVLVIDDAEQLDGAGGSEQLISTLLRAEVPLLRIALASRRPLDLRVAKPRAAGQLTELGAADLAFDTTECSALLQTRTGLDPTAEQIESVMEATEGWPLGVAIAATVVGRRGGARPVLASLSSTPDLQSYLSEELLGSLEPGLEEAAINSSVPRAITPTVARALELPEDFRRRIERSGFLVRSIDDGEAFAYHPLLREFLLERLRASKDDDLRRRLHAAVAPAVTDGGDAIGGIEHWMEAERWPEAVTAIERQGPILLRTSPELLTGWLETLPEEVRELPTIRLLKGQLDWGAGQHERALTPLRQAVEGYREAGDLGREWLARYFLAEAVFSAGQFEVILELAEGWDAPDTPRTNMAAAGIAWYTVVALAAMGRWDEMAAMKGRLRGDLQAAERFRYLADLANLMVELAAGGAENALAALTATTRELELNDPQSRLPVSLSVTALVNLDIGDAETALEWFARCQREAERLGLGFIARDAHLQRASLLARRGEVAEAQRELERAGSRQGTGWRGVSRPTAEAFVASAHGESREAVTAAERALTRVRPGLVCFRVWAALNMAIVLAENGAPDRASAEIAEAMAVLDEQFPGQRGCYHRARLLAARARLEYEAGRRDTAFETLRRCWKEAGDRANHVARAHWQELKPVLSAALENEAIDPGEVLPALIAALPGADALVEFTGHSNPAVRRAALSAALASDHPEVLAELPALIEDSDQEVASAALAARERLRRAAPPLRFGLLGRFRVTRSGREIAEAKWGRPIDARLVRFLAVHRNEALPEDLIFEALWPELSASSARRSLQVAISRVRKVLDLPGVEHSAIESVDRTYRLALGKRDTVDAEEFAASATLALAEADPSPRDLLDTARSRWRGEPLPEDRYEDWARPYRERLVDDYISVLTALIELHGQAGQHARSADLARELVDLDSLNEEGHRALMTAYARSGRRGHALRQYLECRRALVDALGVEPAEETSELQARILAGEPV